MYNLAYLSLNVLTLYELLIFFCYLGASHITEFIVITCLKCQEIVKHLPPYSRFKSYVFWLSAWWALWLLWWPLTDAAMFQCVYGYLHSVFFFLVMFHCCILLEIKLTTTTTSCGALYIFYGCLEKGSIFPWHCSVLALMLLKPRNQMFKIPYHNIESLI